MKYEPVSGLFKQNQTLHSSSYFFFCRRIQLWKLECVFAHTVFNWPVERFIKRCLTVSATQIEPDDPFLDKALMLHHQHCSLIRVNKEAVL